LFAGKTHGFALADDESKFAVWQVEDSSWSLAVIDVAALKTIRKWSVPFAYDGEANGFEIAFADANTVYARTFDTEGRTPLKRFSVTTGRAETVERDCFALASALSGVYYIAHTRSGDALKRITAVGAEVISPSTPYNDLRAITGGRWVTVAGAGKSAVLDTSSNQISGKSACETTTVLPNGTQLYVKKTTLSSDPAICNTGKSR
jgi:hypothetical protein